MANWVSAGGLADLRVSLEQGMAAQPASTSLLHEQHQLKVQFAFADVYFSSE